jgi:hypothetical protein
MKMSVWMGMKFDNGGKRKFFEMIKKLVKIIM